MYVLINFNFEYLSVKYAASGLDFTHRERNIYGREGEGGGCIFGDSKLSTTYVCEKSDSAQFEEIPPEFYECGTSQCEPRVTNTNDYYRAPILKGRDNNYNDYIGVGWYAAGAEE